MGSGVCVLLFVCVVEVFVVFDVFDEVEVLCFFLLCKYVGLFLLSKYVGFILFIEMIVV